MKDINFPMSINVMSIEVVIHFNVDEVECRCTFCGLIVA